MHEQSELVISPIAMDPCIQYEIPTNNPKTNTQDETEDPNVDKPTLLQCLIGCRDGAIYIYDPVLLQKTDVYSYNSDQTMPFFKPKKPEIVRWVEPSNLTNPITQMIKENGQTIHIT